MTGILLVDKGEGWTSSDIVAKLRRVLGERRIGHAGTLDPLATGLMIVMIGRATRASDYLMRHDKEYIAAFKPGITTDTQDISGEIIKSAEPNFTMEQLTEVLKDFTGNISQIPPMYSAIKINGRKLYDIARSGGNVERKPRAVTIQSISCEGKKGGEYILRIKCSSGTYIRTLCNDIGERLGCGGCMSALRRTAVFSEGVNYSISDAKTITEIIDSPENINLLSVDSAFAAYPAYVLSSSEEKKVSNGLYIDTDLKDGLCRLYSGNGDFVMLGISESGRLKSEKSFYEVV